MEIHSKPFIPNTPSKQEAHPNAAQAKDDALQALNNLVSEQWNKVRSHGELPRGHSIES